MRGRSRRGQWPLRFWLSFALLLAALLPAPAFAQQEEEAGPQKPASFFGYGFRGFWDGAVVGLASGQLLTGDTYEDGEWKTLVLGSGIGAVLGVGVGITLAFSDHSSRRWTGWYVLRDLMSGAMLGALTGAAVGALVLIESEHPRDVLTGAAIGTLLGAGAGVAFGIFQGMDEEPRPRAGVHLTLTAAAAPAGAASRIPTLMPTLYGTF